jgi:D-alanyl-D-alanine carboxypeptidase/D-alanyl-D-alanine-endopeptidase (penicillin-binding protein 4)
VRRVVRRRIVAASGLAVLLVAGYMTLDVHDVVPGILTLANPPDPAPASATPTSSPTTVAQPRDSDAGMPLAASGQQQPVPTAAGLQAATAAALASPALAGNLGLTVRDAATGTHLLDLRSNDSLLPASSLKLLSAAAVDATFPSGATLTTKVVQGSAADRVVLVAGGDTLLNPGAGDPKAVAGRAGLGDLVTGTANALRSRGIRAATVSLDLSYAPGPLLAPTWSTGFRATGITGAVAAVGLSSQRATPGKPGPADPAVSVGATFVAGLKTAGVAATLADPGKAPEGAATLAAVTSAPVLDQLALALDESDNALTESLTRQAAYLKGTAPGFEPAAGFVRDTVAALGVDLTGVTTVDASGLSRQNQLPARVLGDVMALGAGGSLAGMADTLRDLPIAGLTGTLTGRFDEGDTHTAAGVAKAKTGTLTGANALAGTVVTADGRLLTFAAIANGTGPEAGTTAARAALDRFVAVLASCGCR